MNKKHILQLIIKLKLRKKYIHNDNQIYKHNRIYILNYKILKYSDQIQSSIKPQ